jgi:hypothetical protein
LARNRQKVLDLVLPRFTVKNTFPSDVMAAMMFKENSRCEWEANVRRP